MKFSNLLFVSFAAALISVSAQAQEETLQMEGQDPPRREVNFDEDKTLIHEHPSQNSAVKDSLSQVPKAISKPARTEAPRETQKERNEEDALSFNFLYYMIQKFKLSDMIDN